MRLRLAGMIKTDLDRCLKSRRTVMAKAAGSAINND